jgi:hypothetical protein
LSKALFLNAYDVHTIGNLYHALYHTLPRTLLQPLYYEKTFLSNNISLSAFQDVQLENASSEVRWRNSHSECTVTAHNKLICCKTKLSGVPLCYHSNLKEE